MNLTLAQKLHLWCQIEIIQSEEEVMEVKDFGGAPEDLVEEFRIGKDMLFRLNSKAAADKEKDDPMWSSTSDLPSDWLFGDE